MSAVPSPCPLCLRPSCPSTRGASLEGIRLRAVRQATDLLGRVLGRRLAEMREDGFTHVRLAAEVRQLRAQLGAAFEAADIAVERWAKVPERRRPYYTPEQRGRILRIRDLLRLSQPERLGASRSRQTRSPTGIRLGRWSSLKWVATEASL